MSDNIHDEGDSDDFGDISDEEFLFAESSDPVISTWIKRTTPADFEDNTDLKKAKVQGDRSAITLAERILQKIWGFCKFRLKQEAAIARLIEGGSAAVIFPTGGGKSLVYQIPALVFDEYDELNGRPPGRGVTLVVSPLIALMKDQVDALKKRGVAAAAMDSSQSRDAWLDTCDKLRRGELKLLYVAPERLNNEGFIAMINATKVRLIAIDEAHCISEWGHAFRPDYLKVARFAKEVKAERVLCLTATATPKVAEDICASFDIEKDGVFRTTTYRPNLRLEAKSFMSGAEKETDVKEFLRKNPGPSIIYVQTHEQTETLCESLERARINAHSYHAGMANDVRTKVQEEFMASSKIVIVATIAFGMGIDKPDIRNIVHYTVPKSLEGYSQEIGRAGRDGLASTCLMYLCAHDIAILEEWSRADVPSLRSVKGLVGELLELHRYAKPGEVIERNLNDESKEWDIRRNALDLLNAQLELRFTLIRSITPRYSQYKYTQPSFSHLASTDTSSTTLAILKLGTPAKKYTHIDISSAARLAAVEREDIVRRLQEWHDRGLIELFPSGVIYRFRVLRDFPRTEAEKAQIIDSIYAKIEAREQSEIDRMHSVIALITSKSCLSRSLAAHFGDEDSVPATPAGCANCTFCITQIPVTFLVADKNTVKKEKIDEKKIKAVLAATKVRDDARFLARVAFGITSPRVGTEKLGKSKVFGSCSGCDFEELVKRFRIDCE